MKSILIGLLFLTGAASATAAGIGGFERDRSALIVCRDIIQQATEDRDGEEKFLRIEIPSDAGARPSGTFSHSLTAW